MTARVGDVPHWPSRSAGRENITLVAVAVLGASGAFSSFSRQDDPGITVTKNGGTTGQYDLVYPASAEPVMFKVTLFSPAATVSQAYVKTKDFPAGTASIVLTSPAGAAAYGASADEIYIEMVTQRVDV